jgi:hypothetical protein
VGDQIDRCRPSSRNMTCDNPDATKFDEANDIVIMELFNNMDIQAKKYGGAVISLLGNHELMNSMGNMQYVSYLGLKQFDNYTDPNDPRIRIESGKEARKYAFSPGNHIGIMIGCTRTPAIIIGSNIFVHAGLVDGLLNEIKLGNENDLNKINMLIRSWLLGLIDRSNVENIIRHSSNSMFWTRILGNIPSGVGMDDERCMNNLGNILKVFRNKKIIIGHTPQSFLHNKNINSTCGNYIWRVDNGSSCAFNDFDMHYNPKTGKKMDERRTQYLEIINDNEYYVCDEKYRKKII